MANIWCLYRAITTCAMLILTTLGFCLIVVDVVLNPRTDEVMEQREYVSEWNEEILQATNIPASINSTDANGSSPNLNLKWHPIPVETYNFEGELYSWKVDMHVSLITIGIFTILFSLLGLLATYLTTPFSIILFVAPMTVFLVVQYLFMVTNLSTSSLRVMDMKSRLRKDLHQQYEIGAKAEKHFTYTLNSIMLGWNCCGVVGPVDFLSMNDMTYRWSHTAQGNDSDEDVEEQRVLRFPPACCRREIRKQGFHALLDCAASGDPKLIYNKGCFSELYERFLQEHGEYLVFVFKSMFGFEVLLVIMVTVLCHVPGRFETQAAKIALEYAKTIEKQVQTSIEQAASENQAILQTIENEARAQPQPQPQAKVQAQAPVDSVEPHSSTDLNRRLVFVPHAKVSSVASETELEARAKFYSTEIW